MAPGSTSSDQKENTRCGSLPGRLSGSWPFTSVKEVVAMRFIFRSLAVLASLTAAPAIAQTMHASPGKVVTGPPGMPSVEPLSHRASNIDGADTRSAIAPALPSVDPGPNATATDYLVAARDALAANQTGRAQAALEDAETLLLTRSVPIGSTNVPDQSPAVRNVSAALQSLASRDLQGAMKLVQQTIPMTQQAQARMAPVNAGPPADAAWPPAPQGSQP
jgi:hypothetical protein